MQGTLVRKIFTRYYYLDDKKGFTKLSLDEYRSLKNSYNPLPVLVLTTQEVINESV
jgi:hypothetical protein